MQECLILPRKSLILCRLIGFFFSERFGPADCDCTSLHVPLDTILNIHGAFSVLKKSLVLTVRRATLGGRKT